MPTHLARPLVALCTLALVVSTTSQANAATRGNSLHRSGATIANVRVSKDQYLAHSEPAIAENPRNPKNLVAGSKMFTDPAHYEFKIGTYYSNDGGRTWHDSGFLPGFEAYRLVSDVSIAFSADGVVYVSVLAWDGEKQSGIYVSRSTDGGETFSDPVQVFLDTSGATFNDKNWIAVDRTTGAHRGTVYVAWNLDGSALGQDPDRPASPSALRPRATDLGYGGMVVSHSTDGGKTFSAPVMVAPFNQEHTYIGAAPEVAPDGQLVVPFTSFDASGAINGIAVVRSKDGGETFDEVRIAQPDVVGLPNHLPGSTFRNTTLPSMAISPKDGSMVIVWSDYRYDDADILATTSRDGGQSWSTPIRVNHNPLGDGTDQFLPVVAVSSNGIYTCAWFDRSYDPKGRLIDEVVAQSSSDGRAFGPALRVTKKSWDPAVGAPQPEGKPSNTFIGDYQALAVDNLSVHPLWNDTQNGKTQEIRTATISAHTFKRR